MKKLLCMLAISAVAIMSSVSVIAADTGAVIFGGAGYTTARSANVTGVAGSTGATIFGIARTQTTMQTGNIAGAKNVTTPSGNESTTASLGFTNVDSASGALGIARSSAIYGGGSEGVGIAAGGYRNIGIGLINPITP